MTEQQRITLAVILSMGIFLGYHMLVEPPPPAAEATATAETAGPAPVMPPAAAAGDGAGLAAVPLRPSPAGPRQSRSFDQGPLRGRLLNEDAGLAALDLRDFAAAPATGAAKEAAPEPLSLAAPGAELQARIQWLLPSAESIALHFTAETQGSTGHTLAGRSAQGVEVEVELQPQADTYGLLYTLRAHNAGQQAVPMAAQITLSLASAPGGGGGLFTSKDNEASLRALCQASGSLLSKEAASLIDAPQSSRGGLQYVGLDRQYFLLAAVPQTPTQGACTLQRQGDRVEAVLTLAAATLAPGERHEQGIWLFAGPKRDAELAAVAPVLTSSIDYTIWKIPLGFLARPMVWLMNLFHSWTHSWGVAIMLLTLVVKSVLLPVTYKSVVAMRSMQELKPELDKIRARHPDDRERQSLEQMKLYRERGVNPFGGCLPTLLQMPVWLALYRTLWSAVDLYHQPFLWLPDLTSKEPYPILAVLLGALTIFQQRLTPMATDNQQARIMMWVMPVMLTFLMVSLPSGLVLYILVNTILTILQHLAINRRAVASPCAAR